MDAEQAVQIGILQTEVTHLQDEVRGLREDVTQILAKLNEAQGGWKTLMYLAGASGTLGAIMSWVVGHVRLT